LIIVCFCTPVIANPGIAPAPAEKDGGKTSVKPKGEREVKTKRPPKEKKETRPDKKEHPSDPPAYKGKRPSPKPREGYKDKWTRKKRPEDKPRPPRPRPPDDPWTPPPPPPCPPDYPIIVEYYVEPGYYGETDFDLEEAAVWVSGISIIVSSIALGSGGDSPAAASFGISAGSMGVLLSTSDDDTYRKMNFVAGAAALVLGLLNAR